MPWASLWLSTHFSSAQSRRLLGGISVSARLVPVEISEITQIWAVLSSIANVLMLASLLSAPPKVKLS